MNVYDFDGTICFKSSPIVFWKICIKRKPIILICFPIQIIGFLLYKYGLIKDPSLFYIFTRFFKDENKVIKEFCDIQQKNMCQWYLKQKMEDDIIVSASPEFLIKEMANRLNVSYVASKVDFKTGKFTNPPCRGKEKVKQLFDKYPNCQINKSYGNSNSDRYIIEAGKEGYMIRNKSTSKTSIVKVYKEKQKTC